LVPPNTSIEDGTFDPDEMQKSLDKEHPTQKPWLIINCDEFLLCKTTKAILGLEFL